MGDAGIKTKSIWSRLKRGSLGLIVALPLTFGIVSKAHSQEKYEPRYTEIQSSYSGPELRATTVEDLLRSAKPDTYQYQITPVDGQANPFFYDKIIPFDPKLNVTNYDNTGRVLEVKYKNYVIWTPDIELKRIKSLESIAQDFPKQMAGHWHDYENRLNNFKIEYPQQWQKFERWRNIQGYQPPQFDSLHDLPSEMSSHTSGFQSLNWLREPFTDEFKIPVTDPFQNLDTIQKPDFGRVFTTPSDYKGLTAEIRTGDSLATIPIAPPDYWKTQNTLQNLDLTLSSQNLRQNKFELSMPTLNNLHDLDMKLVKNSTFNKDFGRVFTTPSDYKGLTAEIRTDNRSTTIPIAPPNYWQQQRTEMPRTEMHRIEIPDPPDPPRIEYHPTSTYGSMGYDPDPFRYGSIGFDPIRGY